MDGVGVRTFRSRQAGKMWMLRNIIVLKWVLTLYRDEFFTTFNLVTLKLRHKLILTSQQTTWYRVVPVSYLNDVHLHLMFFSGLQNPREIDPRLITPIISKIFCCIPKDKRKSVWCGVQHDRVSCCGCCSYSYYCTQGYLCSLTSNGLSKPWKLYMIFFVVWL